MFNLTPWEGNKLKHIIYNRVIDNWMYDSDILHWCRRGALFVVT